MKKDSLVQLETDINPYMMDEDTRRKLNTTHYVLGEGKYREMQERKHQRDLKRQELANKLGVEVEYKLTSKEDVMLEKSRKQIYSENKTEIDELINEALKYNSVMELTEFVRQYNPK
jgi:hypothetical protein